MIFVFFSETTRINNPLAMWYFSHSLRRRAVCSDRNTNPSRRQTVHQIRFSFRQIAYLSSLICILFVSSSLTLFPFVFIEGTKTYETTIDLEIYCSIINLRFVVTFAVVMYCTSMLSQYVRCQFIIVLIYPNSCDCNDLVRKLFD